MPSRQLDFEVFDADNHLYETTEALTKFLPPGRAGLIEYVEVRGRTKIAIKGQISDYIPNPTFDRVAVPGAQEEYFRSGNPDGKSMREIIGRGMDVLPAFRDPAPRLELMDEQGLDRALMWPTLASLVEERLRNDPEAIHDVVHALNQWMHEHWTFNYADRIFPVPVITLPILGRAIAELEWVLERGAKIRSRCSSGISSCTRSTRMTRSASSNCWAPTMFCSARTTPTRKGWPIPSASSRTSGGSRRIRSPRSWVATWPGS